MSTALRFPPPMRLATGTPAPVGVPAARLSPTGLAIVIAAHVGLLALVFSANFQPLAAPVETLMVRLIAPPAPEVTAPPTPPRVEPPRPRPRPQKAPPPRIVTAAKPTPAPAAEAPAPAQPEPVAEAPKTPAPVAAAPVAAEPLVQPRFDADYLDNPKPVYPALARRMGEEGRVVLRVQVDPNGRPGSIAVRTSSGSERLDQAAVAAVTRWRFVPARRGDTAVAASVLVPIVFNLTEQ